LALKKGTQAVAKTSCRAFTLTNKGLAENEDAAFNDYRRRNWPASSSRYCRGVQIGTSTDNSLLKF
jgi:hypothetical protein